MALLLSPEEVKLYLKTLTGWQLRDSAIQKQFEFDSFLPAIDFVNHVAGLAEKADHHPDITINYRRVTMSLCTHSAGGITQKDFDLAKKIDHAEHL